MLNHLKDLRQRQLDRSYAAFRPLPTPARGWLRAIREALGITATELAHRIGSSRQLPLQFERAERDGSITLNSLRKLANAMDCELTYALIPKNGSLKKSAILREQKGILATLQQVEHSMALEGQAAGSLADAVEIEQARTTQTRL